MELLSRSDAAMRLGVTLQALDLMIEDGTLLAVRFATGVRVLIEPDTAAPGEPPQPAERPRRPG